jgi:hypothetical protein
MTLKICRYWVHHFKKKGAIVQEKAGSDAEGGGLGGGQPPPAHTLHGYVPASTISQSLSDTALRENSVEVYIPPFKDAQQCAAISILVFNVCIVRINGDFRPNLL